MWQMDSHLVISPVIVFAVCQLKLIDSCSSSEMSFFKEQMTVILNIVFLSAIQCSKIYTSDERPYVFSTYSTLSCDIFDEDFFGNTD